MRCPLCKQNKAEFSFDKNDLNYYQCPSCFLFFLDPKKRLSREEEKKRYELHENSKDNQGYLDFLRPLLKTILENTSPGTYGLDYGCGPTPVLSELLIEEGLRIRSYDPIFFPKEDLESKAFDFAFSCEAFEHFYSPAQEIEKIRSVLRENASLFIQTRFFSDPDYLAGSHYVRDPTHVIFFNPRTFEYLAEKFRWKLTFPKPNIAFFKKFSNSTPAT